MLVHQFVQQRSFLRSQAVDDIQHERNGNRKFRREVYLNPLEGLYHYFAFGRKIVSADDLAGRLAVDITPIPSSQILRGFEMEYVPVMRTGLATSRQKAALAENTRVR